MIVARGFVELVGHAGDRLGRALPSSPLAAAGGRCRVFRRRASCAPLTSRTSASRRRLPSPAGRIGACGQLDPHRVAVGPAQAQQVVVDRSIGGQPFDSARPGPGDRQSDRRRKGGRRVPAPRSRSRRISLKCGLAAIVAVRSGPMVPMYTPSWTASKRRANAAARLSTWGL